MSKREGCIVNYAEIGRTYNCDPRTVKKYYERDQTVCVRKPRVIKKITDGLEGIIRDKIVNEHAKAYSVFLFLKEYKGYSGSYSTIKIIARKYKDEEKKKARVRFETEPGIQGQIDWKESMSLENRNGELFLINIFLSILGYSRDKYIELTLDREQKTLFRCLTNMFKYWGGCPKELLFDNMKTVVDRARTQFNKAVLNQKFYAFAKDAGFIPITCKSYSPWTKGKVETVAKIMERLRVYNHEFDTLEDLTKIVNSLREEINNEIQATTREKPIDRLKKETGYLNSSINYENLNSYFSETPPSRKVTKESLIQYQGNQYSVPLNYINKSVIVKENNGAIDIFYKNELIRTHKITQCPFNYNPEDYENILLSSGYDPDKIEETCKNNLEKIDIIFGVKE